jgi:hypothetical protein
VHLAGAGIPGFTAEAGAGQDRAEKRSSNLRLVTAPFWHE